MILPLKLEWEPCYSLPDGIYDGDDARCRNREEVRVGDRVKVRFANKVYSGVVSAVDIRPDTDPDKIRPITCIEEGLERILPEEIELWRQVAGYYLCTIGEVYKAAYPAVKISLEEARAATLAKAQERRARMQESMKAKVERIRERIKRKEELIAKAKEGTKARARYEEGLTRIIRELETAQSALESAQHAVCTVTTDTHCTGSTTGNTDTTSTTGKTCTVTTGNQTTASTTGKTCTATTGNHTTGSTTGNTDSTSNQTTAYIDIQNTACTTGSQGTAGEVDTPRTAGKVGTPRAAGKEGTPGPGQEGIMLSPAQAEAYGSVKAAFAKGKPALLHGVTGSGKTEIYIRLAQEAISRGRNILYLVPEIALSRQLEERLYSHFGDRLMTFHSGETAVSRRNTSETIRSYRTTGENYIVLGTRSSLVLPHHNLGLIIVDEEHDSSYKQDSPAPRYNGRDTALMASVIHKADIILGSATPSLEELYNCECGKHALIELKERYHGSEDSDIELIDTKAERRKRGMHGSFSRKLIEHIKGTLQDGGQVMILRSRRAWAPALQCEECGEIQKCPHCNVSMSLHNAGKGGLRQDDGMSLHNSGIMVCHYCGYRTAYTGTCTRCGGTLKSLGAGTQKIEEEAIQLFPEARIARLDSDTAQNKNEEKRIIKEFSRGETDILIGTQMLGKGFDFSNLRLVAVIAADNMLGLQDFRADEKALQLLEQFRGRCGRRGSKGMFIIQTAQPQHPIYQHITNNEPQLFSTSLLEERKLFDFPPYTRIVEITFRDIYEDRAERMAGRLASILHAQYPGVTGPYAPAVDKVADRYIRTIRISLPKDSRLKSGKAALMQTIRTFEKDNRYDGHITVNVDPA